LRLSFGVANGLVHRSFWTLFHPFFYRLFWYLSCTRKTQTTTGTHKIRSLLLVSPIWLHITPISFPFSTFCVRKKIQTTTFFFKKKTNSTRTFSLFLLLLC
jgi:hypothetical protein